MKMVLGWLAVIGGFLILRILLKLNTSKRIRRLGFPYVYVNEDGTIRPLIQKEKNYLSQKFDPDKGKLPNIKSNYKAHGPEGKMSGFLHIKKVPFWKKIG